jgi:ubiquitin-conjugating enzyme E2 R
VWRREACNDDMANQPTSSALRTLALEYKSIQEEPVEGFRVRLVNDDNLCEWEVAIFGPPDTLYAGGYFKVSLIKYRKRL